MALKDTIENHAVVIFLGALIVGFGSGFAAKSQLNATAAENHTKIVSLKDAHIDYLETQLENKIEQLESSKITKEEIDQQIREEIINYLNRVSIIEGQPLGGDNSVVRKAVMELDDGEISRVIKDPINGLKLIDPTLKLSDPWKW